MPVGEPPSGSTLTAKPLFNNKAAVFSLTYTGLLPFSAKSSTETGDHLSGVSIQSSNVLAETCFQLVNNMTLTSFSLALLLTKANIQAVFSFSFVRKKAVTGTYTLSALVRNLIGTSTIFGYRRPVLGFEHLPKIDLPFLINY